VECCVSATGSPRLCQSSYPKFQVSTGEDQNKDRVDLKLTALFVRNLKAFLNKSTVEQIASIGAIGNAGEASVPYCVYVRSLYSFCSCSSWSNANFLKPVTRTCKFKCLQGVLASETGYSYLHRRCVELERSALVLLFPSSIQTPNHECAAPLSPRSRLL
jgi:hypothetical protein